MSVTYTALSQLNGSCYATTLDSAGNLYAAGNFTTAGGVTVNYVAKWDGTSWSPLGATDSPGVNGPCYAIAFNSLGILYLGGSFNSNANGSIDLPKIAKLQSGIWTALSVGTNVSGLNNTCFAIAFDSSNTLYVGGSFTQVNIAGGTTVGANRIARYNGTTWDTLSSGFNSTCRTLAFNSSGVLYAGGDFTTAGSLSRNRIAFWNTTTTSWSALTTEGLNNSCYTINFNSAGTLYAGGLFTTAGTSTVNRIASWNGSTWSSVGNGFLSGICYAITFDQLGRVYAGGSFTTTTDGTLVNYIARLNGSSWYSLSPGFNNNCTTLAINILQGYLYAGGDFTSTSGGGVTTNYIALIEGIYNVGYTRSGTDLVNIFSPYKSGTQSSITKYHTLGSDLSTIFQKLGTTSTLTYPFTTGYKTGTTPVDLNTLFELYLIDKASQNIYTQQVGPTGSSATLLTITSSGTIYCNYNLSNVFCLLVGGGGGGGGTNTASGGEGNAGGGGGAGELAYGTIPSIAKGKAITFTIGQGGTGGTTAFTQGSTGGETSIVFFQTSQPSTSTISVKGGGGGGAGKVSGASGGSGGGGGSYSASSTSGGTAVTTTDSFSFTHLAKNGAAGQQSGGDRGGAGGGGGATTAGTVGGSSTGSGDGGDGYTWTTLNLTYGGGGGGGSNSAFANVRALGGAGGGGAGGYFTSASVNVLPDAGTANTGGGGGGGQNTKNGGGRVAQNGAAGGSGVCILYITQANVLFS